MTGGFPLLGSTANPSSSGATATSCTTGVANTKGSWTQLIASTANDAAAILLSWECYLNGAHIVSGLDIGIGAAGSEQVIINNLTSFRDNSGFTFPFAHHLMCLPISIPAGTRVAIRGQASGGSASVRATASLLDGGFTSGVAASAVDSVGFNTASSLGTAVTPGVASKGSYAQLTASTSYDYSGFFICLDDQAASNSPQYNPSFDIAIGAAGSEVIIVPDIYFFFSPSSLPSQAISPLIMAPIPAGSRVAVRAQIDTTAWNIGVTLYGLRQ